MSQETTQGQEAAPRARQPMPAQGSTPQHIAPGYEHLFCQCGCGAPVEAAGAVHAAAAAQRQLEQQQQPGGHSHGVQFGGAGQGMMHAPHPPSMYPPGPYTGQQDMQQFQSQFAAAAAMSQYANYGRGISEIDPYRGQHMPYRPPVELPRGYMVLAPPPGVAYLTAAAPQMSYYRQYGGMMHMAGAGGEHAGGKMTGAAAAGVGGAPPEEAPPPPHASPTAAGSAAATATTAGGGGHPKESILESLLAARSERLSAASASADAEDVAAAATHDADGASVSPSSSSFASSSTVARARLGAQFAAAQVAGATVKKSQLCSDADDVKPAIKPMGLAGVAAAGIVHQPPSPSIMASSHTRKDSGAGAAGSVGVKASHTNSSNASAAASALHLAGLRGGFIGGMHGIGSMRGMAPPLPTSPNCGGGGGGGGVGGGSPSMRYMKSVGALPQPPHPSQATQPYGAHDALDEQVRQQEKKLQKRAANRKSAQLSRKRKKALIEELRYENQDLQRHEDILEVIPDPVFAFDTSNGRVWFASTSASAQFGLPVETLNSSCFFDLMTDDCSKRLRVLVETALKDVSETNSALLHERMTVRFKKRKGAILLGELSGRLSCQGGVTTAVCSVRPLSLATDEIVGKGYIGDASMSELAEDTSADQGSSGEDSRSTGMGPTSGGSNGDSSSGLGTGCTSIADEVSSSGVPSLSSLEVKRGGGGGAGSKGSRGGTGRSSSGGSSGGSSSGSSSSGSSSSSSRRCSGNSGSGNRNENDASCPGGGGGGGGSSSSGSGNGSSRTSGERSSVGDGGSRTGRRRRGGGSEEGDGESYNSDSAPSSGGQEGDDETYPDSDGGREPKRSQAMVTAASLQRHPRSAVGGGATGGGGGGGDNKGTGMPKTTSSASSSRRRPGTPSGVGSPTGRARAGRREETEAGAAIEVRQWEVAASLDRSGKADLPSASTSQPKR